MNCIKLPALGRAALLPTIAALALWALLSTLHAEEGAPASRPAARKLHKDGNYREAWEQFRRLTLAETPTDQAEVVRDIRHAVDCLQRLNEAAQIDAYLEQVAEVHAHDWQILSQIAASYWSIAHHGVIVSGEFRRGHHRGGGEPANAWPRDRVRALQLFWQAYQLVDGDPQARASQPAARLLQQFASAVRWQHYHDGAWRLQLLTDLSELPEVERGWAHFHGSSRGAPVDADGDPIFYDLPASWAAAANDGQRWRWLLAQRTAWQPHRLREEIWERAHFLQSQFGVQTLAEYDWFGRQEMSDGDDESGIYAVHTLTDGETIARLATGIKRFDLPSEHNHILLLKQWLETGDRPAAGDHGAASLATWYENRRQYPRAAELWKSLIDSGHKSYQRRYDAIIGNWGALEPVITQPAGRGATLHYRFRNGSHVDFTAQPIEVDKLLADLKAYLKAAPRQLDWQKLQIQSLGYRLVHEGQDKYVGDVTARWSVELEPRENHFDRRTTVTTPLQKAGAYLLTARMRDGNTQSVVVWVADTAIVKKPLEGKSLYYVADANTGKPIADCNVEFFGYWQEHLDGNRFQIHTKNFAEKSNAQGITTLVADDQTQRHQWIATARTDGGRLAFLGFSGVWHGSYYDATYNQVKCLAVTDRPVYRPGHKVQFKFWVRHAQFDAPDESRFANQTFQIEIRDPQNEQVLSQSLTADAYGGLAGEWTAPADAALGQYRLQVVNHGGGAFRIEEYKKPEYEVTIDGPDEPAQLGDKIVAKIRAEYYFGAPVADAVVKYKVLRTAHQQSWYPPMPWDWLYGPGYWWFAPEYPWYPGYLRWGCRGPSPWWFWQAPTPPELIAQQEVAIGPDGTVEVEIDTALAKQFHGDEDHSYQIQAEVVDQSRRTVVANGEVLVARQPFRVHVWTDRGFYQAGDTIDVGAAARTIAGQPVTGTGILRLLAIRYRDGEPIETEAARWNLDIDDQGLAGLQITAAESGQYRLAFEMTDDRDRTVAGGVVLTIRGTDFAGREFRFNDVEIIPDQRQYAPGDKVSLQISADQAGAAVLLFLRPSNGIYLPPRLVQLDGKSTVVEFEVAARDMPNFFVEAVTVHGGKLHAQVREIFVPPVERVLNVEVVPSADGYLPGQHATVQLKLTDHDGRAFVGSTVVAIYDKALEYISGGSNVPNIKEFFWKWRRSHRERSETNLGRYESPLGKPDQPQMQSLGVFGGTVADDEGISAESRISKNEGGRRLRAQPAPMAAAAVEEADAFSDDSRLDQDNAALPPAGTTKQAEATPVVRQNFADTALWAAALETNADGIANVELDMPENLTTWKINVWGMGHGTRVGHGAAEVVTRKNLIVRLQAPRFFVETDEVMLSANVHNYLDEAKQVRVRLELDGGTLQGPERLETTIEVAAGGEKRVDWRVKAIREGEAVVRMAALTDEESDAMQMRFPVYVHGMLRTESYSGAVPADEISGGFTFTIPQARRPDQTRVEIRYTPTLAGAMLDALPYLADYPYGCTEQTLNRFLPSAITQRTLQRLGVDLAAVKKQQQRVDRDGEGAGLADTPNEAWKRTDVDPVFDEAELNRRVKAGVNRLTEMQLSDGGWGWFSGGREQSTPHTTAVVVRGLLIAQQNDVAVVPDVVQRGVEWLKRYQAKELKKLNNWDREARHARDKNEPAKGRADNLDALVYMVLAEADHKDDATGDYLYVDRTHLAPYSLAACGLAFHKQGEKEKTAMILRNLDQFVKQDDENQTAWLDLPGGYWWLWYGSEYEAHAYYLKLLVAVEPESDVAPRLVKYLLNNRKHASYWNSTRDTALVVEALADYLLASGEGAPDLKLDVLVDGQVRKTVVVTPENLFSFDDRLILEGAELAPGKHTIELRREGSSPCYFSGYVTNFTLEDSIEAAGLELKVERQYYLLTPRTTKTAVAGDRGQAIQQSTAGYDRSRLVNFAELTSGDLVEVELTIHSKNDYEYLLLEDKKPAGCEAVGVRSGYNGNEIGAYVEYRDDRVALLARRIARGTHSVSYRLRAEVPGRFSALPTTISAMYAPELRGNSDEAKLVIED